MSMHIDAQVGEIAERVVVVGDPLRAKHTAETYLADPVLVTADEIPDPGALALRQPR